MGELTFILGGARSGKSRIARDRALAFGRERVTFVATAAPGDPELDARIAAHRRDRPASWTTIEASDDLATTLAGIDDERVILLDSLTLWASLALERGRDLVASWDAAAAVVDARRSPTIVVSDDVGGGIVPMSELARRFRDELGFVHQRIASRASIVLLCVAGLPLALKGEA